MAVRHIVYYPDPPLTLKAEPVTEFGAELEKLAQDLFDTMQAYEGVGLAAPQVGLSKRLFVAREPDGVELVVVNPELDALEGEELGQEGCLSMPELYADVPRATSLVLRAQDVYGKRFEMEVSKFLARIIQHEFDHLEGVLFLDRLDIFTKQAILQEWEGIRTRLLADPQPTPGGQTAN
jgi:peptide deformylase